MMPAYSAERSSTWASALAVVPDGRGPVSENTGIVLDAVATLVLLTSDATLTGTREYSRVAARTWAASQVGQNGEPSSTEALQRGQGCSTAIHYLILIEGKPPARKRPWSLLEGAG
jgi:hypothetical protein